MYNTIKLSVRLSAAASLVGAGTVADIGTDHALLPIKLVLAGHSRALASDINEGPCERARANIMRYRLSDRIAVCCRPGLDRIDEFAPDNIIICGMGGELIADILAQSGYPRESACRLILQPMSMQDVLRKYLAANGFNILNELVVFDEGKYYQLIASQYDGVKRSYSETEYRLGRLNLLRAANESDDEQADIDRGWLGFVRNAAAKRVAGRSVSEASANSSEQSDDVEMIKTIDEIMKGQN
ncbi:MAG: SAM-dependent methyltransferase [Clostridiales bacterium]|nr:SAM-dependent methyltransferase [Clostridiales bacterium]